MSEDFRALPSPQTQGVLGSGLEMTCDPPEGVPEPVVRFGLFIYFLFGLDIGRFEISLFLYH